MRTKWNARLSAAASGAAIALLMLYPAVAMDAVRAACNTFVSGVMPALFPFLVFSQMLASGPKGDRLVVPLAMIGGSPAGARLIALSGCGASKAQRRAALCGTVSPAFILGALSGDARMLLSHWAGAAAAWAFVCALQRFCVRDNENADKGGNSPFHREAKRCTLPEAIRDGALAMLSVCGTMALFSVVTALAARVRPMPAGIAAALGCALEMAGGCARVRALGLPEEVAAPLLCAAASFGGLAIFMQNAGYLKQAGVNLRTQFAARVVHAAAAFLICWVCYRS